MQRYDIDNKGLPEYSEDGIWVGAEEALRVIAEKQEEIDALASHVEACRIELERRGLLGEANLLLRNPSISLARRDAEKQATGARNFALAIYGENSAIPAHAESWGRKLRRQAEEYPDDDEPAF